MTLKSTMSIDAIRRSFADMPELLKQVLPEKARKTNAIKDNLEYLHQLLKQKTDKTGGW